VITRDRASGSVEAQHQRKGGGTVNRPDRSAAGAGAAGGERSSESYGHALGVRRSGAGSLSDPSPLQSKPRSMDRLERGFGGGKRPIRGDSSDCGLHRATIARQAASPSEDSFHGTGAAPGTSTTGLRYVPNSTAEGGEHAPRRSARGSRCCFPTVRESKDPAEGVPWPLIDGGQLARPVPNQSPGAPHQGGGKG